MPRPRKAQISLEATPYYHCTSRCVRRAFLCGETYEHRREWVESRILELANVFAIDVAVYAVISNHYHLVLHINSSDAGRFIANIEIFVHVSSLFFLLEVSMFFHVFHTSVPALAPPQDQFRYTHNQFASQIILSFQESTQFNKFVIMGINWIAIHVLSLIPSGKGLA